MSDIKFTVNVDEYLSLNKYEVDESMHTSSSSTHPSDAEFDKLIRVCPAALYKRDEDGNKSFDYAGCLRRCGTCRVACGDTIIKKWENPQPTMGVEYRFRLRRLRLAHPIRSPPANADGLSVSAGTHGRGASGAHARQGTNAAIAFRSFVSEACFTLQSTDVAILRLAVLASEAPFMR